MAKSISTKLNSSVFKSTLKRNSKFLLRNPEIITPILQETKLNPKTFFLPSPFPSSSLVEISQSENKTKNNLFLNVSEVPGSSFYDSFESPVGKIILLGSFLGLHAVALTDKDGSMSKKQLEIESKFERCGNEPLLQQAQKELNEYFDGKRTIFSVPLAPIGGTPFQNLVWKSLEKIPYAQTLSYSEQALSIGLSETSSRAVGTANGRNPFAIMVPCHRVISKNGGLTGYMGGLDKKKYLLELELASGRL